jgi:hypothetical protein
MYTEQETQEILELIGPSTELYSKVIFPNRFYRPFSPKIHSKIFNLIDDENKQFIAIAAPRGIGKTSILNLTVPAKAITLRERRFILIISASSTAAIEQCENLKEELTGNETILELFGDCKGDKWSSERWQAEWKFHEIDDEGNIITDDLGQPQEFKEVINIIPRGAGQQVRGKLFKDFRPDLIIVDDLEDPDNMDSDEQRDKKKKWFFADVMKAIDQYTPRPGEPKPRIIVLGTILHEDSLLQNLLDDPKFESVRLEICDDELKSNWPEAITDEQIELEYNQYKERGLLGVFFREMRNLPTVRGEDADFHEKLFKYFDERDIQDNPNLFTVIITDPAKKSTGVGAKTAINGISVDNRKESIYHRRCVNDFLDPGEVINKTIDMAVELRATHIAIEVTGLNEFATYPLKNELIRRNLHHIKVIELKARRGGTRGQGKVQRVLSLKPFYKNGQIYHSKIESKSLESQLLSFPKPTYWDVMDSVAYITEILEMGLIYFDLIDEDDESEYEQEYQKLLEETEPPLEYDQIL